MQMLIGSVGHHKLKMDITQAENHLATARTALANAQDDAHRLHQRRTHLQGQLDSMNRR